MLKLIIYVNIILFWNNILQIYMKHIFLKSKKCNKKLTNKQKRCDKLKPRCKFTYSSNVEKVVDLTFS